MDYKTVQEWLFHCDILDLPKGLQEIIHEKAITKNQLHYIVSIFPFEADITRTKLFFFFPKLTGHFIVQKDLFQKNMVYAIIIIYYLLVKKKYNILV